MPDRDPVALLIRAYLRQHPELRKEEYQDADHPLAGHCYVASEAYFHARGGHESGLTPARVQHEGTTHWWLETEDGAVVDLTAEQFQTEPPYEEGTRSGFLTREPSKRARSVLEGIGLSTGERERTPSRSRSVA